MATPRELVSRAFYHHALVAVAAAKAPLWSTSSFVGGATAGSCVFDSGDIDRWAASWSPDGFVAVGFEHESALHHVDEESGDTLSVPIMFSSLPTPLRSLRDTAVELCRGVATASLWCLPESPARFWGRARYFVSLVQPPEESFERFGRSCFSLHNEDRDLAVRLGSQAFARSERTISAGDRQELTELARETANENPTVPHDLGTATRLLAEIGLIWP